MNSSKFLNCFLFNLLKMCHFLFQVTNIVEGRYVFRLKVTDDQGASSEDTVSVNVKPGIVNLLITYLLLV